MESIILENELLKVRVTNYGAIIQEIWVRDKTGKSQNIVLGHENPENYQSNPMYWGACIGRYAGRLTDSVEIAGKTYRLQSDSGVHLHGGTRGFDKKIWTVESIIKGDEPAVKLSYISKDGEESYPGKLEIVISYTLIKNKLEIVHKATTDKKTILNLTNHSYFNLSPGTPVNNQYLQLESTQFLEVDDKQLPTGNFVDVSGTPYDFRRSRQIQKTRMDDTFVVSNENIPQAKIWSPKTGIQMEVVTNQPGIVIYTPESPASICFETQKFSNTPNCPHFPSVELAPGEVYENKSAYSFSVESPIQE